MLQIGTIFKKTINTIDDQFIIPENKLFSEECVQVEYFSTQNSLFNIIQHDHIAR